MTEQARRAQLSLPLCGQSRERDLLPNLESIPEFLPVCRGSKPMPARAEVLRDGAIG